MEYTVIVRVLFWGLAFFNCVDSKRMANSKVTFSFDASDVTWAHAVNSREELESELDGPVEFLEADVSLGFVQGNEFGPFIPIMAHPPDASSDISLDMWIQTVIQRNTSKGVKLDFKTIEVVEPSLIILEKHSHMLNFSLWLNADILYGPIHALTVPVKDDLFLLLCRQYFPNAVLSVGWTTYWHPTLAQETWHYEWKHVRKMADIIRCFGYENHYPTFTFPVRGTFASRSIKKLQWLLGVVPNSFLTVWSAKEDPLEVGDLLKIRKSFPYDKVYYDVPENIRQEFLKVKNTTVYDPETEFSLSTDQWMTITHGQGSGSQCTSSSYVSNNTIVFGQSLPTAVLLKKLIAVDDKYSFKAEGRVEFFNSQQALSATPESYELKIVFADVSLFSKNLTKGSFDLTESDTDVLWSAMNASQLHTFQQTGTDRCRLFKLDTEKDRSFQAWNVPCGEINDEVPLEEIAKTGIQEIPINKRLILPAKPFMMGFLYYGDGSAVIHNLKISNKKDVDSASSTSMAEISVGLMGLIFTTFVIFGLI